MATATPSASAPARDGLLAPARAPLTVGMLLIVSTVAFEAMAVATVLPAAVDDLGGLRLYGWSFSAFMLGSLISAVAASDTADRRGPGAPFAVGMALFVAGLVVSGLSPAMPVFIAGRALQGCGGGVIGAMAYVSISRGYPEEMRPRMLAWLSSAWVLPALIGPAIAGVVADLVVWRVVFLGLLPLPAVAALLMLPPLRRLGVALEGGGDRGRIPAALRLSAGTVTLLAGLSAGRVLFAVPLVAVGLVVAVPALRRLMPSGGGAPGRGLVAALATRGMLTFAFFGAEAFVPLALTTLRGLSTAEAGIPLTASALGWTAGSWIQARLERRDAGAGRAGRTAAGLAILLAGGGLMAAGVLVDRLPALLVAAGWGLAGLGMGLAYSTLTLIVLGAAPAGKEGATSSSLQVTEQISIAVGAGLGSAAINLARALDRPEGTGIGAAFALACVAGVAGLLLSRRLSDVAHSATAAGA